MNRRIMMVQPKAQEEIIVLPDEYQRVEYIESTGARYSGQYIDTGHKPSANCRVIIDGAFTSLPASFNQSFGTFGASSWTSNAPTRFYIPRVEANKNYYGMCLGSVFASQAQSATADTNRHVFEGNRENKTFYIDGTAYYLGGTTADCTTPFFFFSNTGTNGGKESMASFRLYRAKIVDGAESLDYIPCYRKADGVIGLYELSNNEFLINKGNGTFSKGADVA